ncbi:MAG: MEDS domain-containing protein [Actinomycetota bacterium]
MHDHLVEFYESDELLVDSVRDFFTPALQACAPVILVATAAHRAAIIDALEARGFDIEAARRQEEFVDLDAAETLSRFMVGNFPDPARFEQVVGELIRSVGKGSQELRIYGEMVALLWDEGNRNGALRLEELWNNLSRTQPFTLLCAYPLTSIDWGSDSAQFRGICSTHTSVRLRFAAPQALKQAEPQEAQSDDFARLRGIESDFNALKCVIRNANQMGRLADNKKTVSQSGPDALDYDLTL